MSWTAPRTWVAAETLTAALLNTHVRDNLLETAPAKVTTKGDLTVATAANSISRLAVGTNAAVLVSDSAASTGVRWSSTGKTATAGTALGLDVSTTLTMAANSDVATFAQISAGVVASVTYTGLTTFGLRVAANNFSKTGTGTIDTAYGIFVAAPTIATTNWALYGSDGNYRLGGTSSKVFIGDDANTEMAAGVTVNTGVSAGEVFAAKNSLVAHGVTSVAETDTYATLEILNAGATPGGVALTGLRTGASAVAGVNLRSIVAVADTTKSTAGIAAISLNSALISGTSTASLGANTNLASIADNGTVRFIFDADGDSHEDGTGWTAYDDYDDVALLQALDHSLDKRLNAQAGAWLRENKAALQAARIVTFNDDTDGVPFINRSRLAMLHTGAIRQLSDRLNSALSRLELAERKLALIS